MTAHSLSSARIDEILAELRSRSPAAVRLARWHDAEVAVAFGEQISADWAQYYFGPYVSFEEPPADAGVPMLHVHYGLVREIEALQSSDGYATTLHSGRPGWWFDTGDVLVARRLDTQIVYLIDRRVRQVHILIGALTPETIREPARHLRELLLRSSTELEGFRPLHCSGVVTGEGALLFVAAKGGGKTSSLLSCLDVTGVDYFCNDRALIGVRDGQLIVQPYAFSVRIGAGSALNHPRLASHLHGFDHTIARLLPLDEQLAHPDKLELTPHELAGIVGTVVRTDSVPVRAVVEPRLSLDGAAPTITELAADRSRELLIENILDPDPDRLNWIAEELLPQPAGAVELTPVPTFSAVGSARQISTAALAAVRGAASGAAIDIPTGQPAPVSRWLRRTLTARLVAVMGHRRADRGLKLSSYNSRVVRRDDVHEFLVTATGDQFLSAASYLGFAAFDQSGVLLKGAPVRVRGRLIGKIAGFDLTHADNHLNVVIESSETQLAALPHGESLGLGVDDELVVEQP